MSLRTADVIMTSSKMVFIVSKVKKLTVFRLITLRKLNICL